MCLIVLTLKNSSPISENGVKKLKGFFLLLSIKNILKNVLIFILVQNTQLLVPSDFLLFVFLFFFYQSQWGPATVWLPTFFKISYFVSRTRIQINTGLVQHDRIDIFG